MDQIQVHIIHAQCLKGLRESGFCVFVAVHVVLQFARDKDLFPLDPAFPYGLAHALFIAVHRCCVDVAVARLQGGGGSVYGGFAVRDLPGAKPHTGNAYAV